MINEERSADEYRILLTKAEKAIQKQKAYIVVLEAKLSDDQEDEEIQRPDPTLEVLHFASAPVFRLIIYRNA